jgi:lysophospholipase L1-like esterase
VHHVHPGTAAAKPRIVFLGDSLTRGLGLARIRSFPSLIEKKLKEKGSTTK